MHSFFSRHFGSPIPSTAVTLAMLAMLLWSSGCTSVKPTSRGTNPVTSSGKIHDAAARSAELEKVKALLKVAPDWVFSTTNNNHGYTPLHIASVDGFKDMAKLLLANKANVDAKSNNGLTPLHLAAEFGHRDVAEELLNNGADVNARSYRSVGNGKQGYYTPLHYAVRSGHKDVAEVLLANGADVNAKANDGNTPLHCAAIGGYKDIAELLLANKADVNAINERYLINYVGGNPDRYRNLPGRGGLSTPLHYAVESGHKDVAEVLLANGADANAKDYGGNSPLQLAENKGSLRYMIELLRRYGAHD